MVGETVVDEGIDELELLEHGQDLEHVLLGYLEGVKIWGEVRRLSGWELVSILGRICLRGIVSTVIG